MNSLFGTVLYPSCSGKRGGENVMGVSGCTGGGVSGVMGCSAPGAGCCDRCTDGLKRIGIFFSIWYAC